MNENQCEALLLQGKIFYQSEEWESAAQAFEQAILVQKADPQKNGAIKASTYYYTGLCFEKIKDLKKSMAQFKQCLTLD